MGTINTTIKKQSMGINRDIISKRPKRHRFLIYSTWDSSRSDGYYIIVFVMNWQYQQCKIDNALRNLFQIGSSQFAPKFSYIYSTMVLACLLVVVTFLAVDRATSQEYRKVQASSIWPNWKSCIYPLQYLRFYQQRNGGPPSQHPIRVPTHATTRGPSNKVK